VQSLIRKQIKGDSSLNYDPSRGKVSSPLLLWGPYLWVDGEKPRRGENVTFSREDFARDGTHPSASGRKKLAGMLLDFFMTDPYARRWFATREPAATQR
jgi:hypothetical protein